MLALILDKWERILHGTKNIAALCDFHKFLDDERATFVITRFEDLLCGVTDEPKKNTKADKKNKRSIVILALLLYTDKRVSENEVKKFSDFVYLIRT